MKPKTKKSLKSIGRITLIALLGTAAQIASPQCECYRKPAKPYQENQAELQDPFKNNQLETSSKKQEFPKKKIKLEGKIVKIARDKISFEYLSNGVPTLGSRGISYVTIEDQNGERYTLVQPVGFEEEDSDLRRLGGLGIKVSVEFTPREVKTNDSLFYNILPKNTISIEDRVLNAEGSIPLVFWHYLINEYSRK